MSPPTCHRNTSHTEIGEICDISSPSNQKNRNPWSDRRQCFCHTTVDLRRQLRPSSLASMDIAECRMLQLVMLSERGDGSC